MATTRLVRRNKMYDINKLCKPNKADLCKIPKNKFMRIAESYMLLK